MMLGCVSSQIYRKRVVIDGRGYGPLTPASKMGDSGEALGKDPTLRLGSRCFQDELTRTLSCESLSFGGSPSHAESVMIDDHGTGVRCGRRQSQ
jgi:hypothetical protein